MNDFKTSLAIEIGIVYKLAKEGVDHTIEANKAILKLIDEAVGSDEQTPEAFKDWKNYSAESPTVREHYRNELRQEIRKKVGL